MNRNVESHFAELPRVDIGRSILDLSSGVKLSGDAGNIIPFYCLEVLPGSTYKVKTSMVIRLQTLLTPIMSNVYCDTYYFFVPNRILWSHWVNFMGESENAWIPTNTPYTVPQTSAPSGGWNVGTIADYLGVPPGVSGLSVNSLPFRGYAAICDQWFRDQNLCDPLVITTGDSTTSGSNAGAISDIEKGGLPFKASKYHDYFTSCLPAPQKGPNVSIFGNGSGDQYIPVKGLDYPGINVSDSSIIKWRNRQSSTDYAAYFGNSDTDAGVPSGAHNADWSPVAGTGSWDMTPLNLVADLSVAKMSVNDLRIAFAMQKFYERSARSGSRYRETLLAHFGTHSPDARMMIPEYLGGHRFPLSIHQVANQSQGATDFLGDLGAMSNTSDVHDDFIYSSTEHGFILGVMVIRYDHGYPQGLHKMWSRETLFDYYWPELANVGEVPVYKKEIYATGTPADDNVFGYQEAWAEYRYMPDRVCGEMRPGIANSLASWHTADYYTSAPTLSDAWIRETPANLDRCLAVTSAVSNQFFADIYVSNRATLPMPVFSVPGLIDHH